MFHENEQTHSGNPQMTNVKMFYHRAGCSGRQQLETCLLTSDDSEWLCAVVAAG